MEPLLTGGSVNVCSECVYLEEGGGRRGLGSILCPTTKFLVIVRSGKVPGYTEVEEGVISL